MPITAANIQLLESERMADTPDGGGRRRNVVIPDGVAGNVFPRVSRLDSVYGRVNLRKVYGAVQTADLDVYAGAHAAVMDPPDNDRIHCVLFSTNNDFDVRTAARDRIESYVIAGPESRMILYGRQLIGQQSILAYQRVEEPIPEVGEVYALSRESGTTVLYQQYVRVGDVESEIRTFTDGDGDFTRRVVTIQIGSPLRYEFAGPDSPTRQTAVARESRLRVTTVADASRYFGTSKLFEVAAASGLAARVETIFAPIVPSTQRETAVSLAELSGAAVRVPGESIEFLAGTFGGEWHVGTGVIPGSVEIRRGAAGSGTPIAGTDNGLGEIIFDPTGPWAGQTGTVDYETGRVEVSITFVSDIISITVRVAGTGAQPSHTRGTLVTLGNRGTVYSEVLNPLPTPGSVIVDYRALGRWYRLRDDGNGGLVGADPSFGSGTVNYVTGSVVYTLGALPDVDSSLILLWGSPAHFTSRTGASADVGTTMRQTFTLSNLPINPASLTLTITSGGVDYTATTSGAGVITGPGMTGSVNGETGEVSLEFTTRLPDPGTQTRTAYNQQQPTTPGNQVVIVEPQTLSAGFTLNQLPTAGSVRFQMRVVGAYGTSSYRVSVDGVVLVRDDGAGFLVVSGGQYVASTGGGAGVAATTAETIVGTINYATGAIVLYATTNLNVRLYEFLALPLPAHYEWVTSVVAIGRDTAYAGSIVYRPTGVGVTLTARTQNFPYTTSPLRLDLTRTVADAILPGSVHFRIASKRYVDRQGVLYTDIVDATGAGTAAGTINYTTGEATLTLWDSANGAAFAITVQNCATTYGQFSSWYADFRTAGSPIRPASLFVQATGVDGTLLTATSDQNGVITGTYARGNINQTMGTVHIEWGEMVVAAGNESQPWYDPANVSGGNIWRPRFVFPNTIRYSAVVLSNLPLNADILGLDPVRLPSDGRVPIFRPGDVVVVHHTGTVTLPNPALANSVHSAGRINLQDIWLVDQNNVKVPLDQYTVNLAAGTVTMAAVLNLTGLVQPLRMRHRIEELNLLSDVQINGQIGLTQPLIREYPIDSYISSALLFGDMQARAFGLFDQATWTNVWSDTLIGSQATGQYNNIDYPIEVLNNGAVTERWRINFTSTTAFQVIGENLGVIGTGSTAADFTVNNPLTGLPYFVIRAAGWGAGWSVGNNLRFNTAGATAPIWIARVILPGATLNGDSFDLQLRGDVDA